MGLKCPGVPPGQSLRAWVLGPEQMTLCSWGPAWVVRRRTASATQTATGGRHLVSSSRPNFRATIKVLALRSTRRPLSNHPDGPLSTGVGSRTQGRKGLALARCSDSRAGFGVETSRGLVTVEGRIAPWGPHVGPCRDLKSSELGPGPRPQVPGRCHGPPGRTSTRKRSRHLPEGHDRPEGRPYHKLRTQEPSPRTSSLYSPPNPRRSISGSTEGSAPRKRTYISIGFSDPPGSRMFSR